MGTLKKSFIRGTVFSFILLCLAYNVTDEFAIRQHSQIAKNISETDAFRNPRMTEETYFHIREITETEDANFIKVTAVVLHINRFDLQRFIPEKMNIKRINRIYKKMKKSDGFKEYYNSIQAVLGDVCCFPIAFDKNKKYTFHYEDSFGSERNYNGSYSHEGTDIMAGINKSGIYPVISVCDGVVENIGWLPKGGYRIGIRGKSNGYFYYAHLDKEGIAVKAGQHVKGGQFLGYMGDTGYGEEGTRGMFPVHLHFGIYIKTENYEELSINPYFILKYLENYPRFSNYDF